MKNIESRVQAIRRAREDSQRKVAQLEGQLAEMDSQKQGFLDEFKELEVKPKDAPDRIKELEAEIETQLAEAERIIRETQDD